MLKLIVLLSATLLTLEGCRNAKTLTDISKMKSDTASSSRIKDLSKITTKRFVDTTIQTPKDSIESHIPLIGLINMLNDWSQGKNTDNRYEYSVGNNGMYIGLSFDKDKKSVNLKAIKNADSLKLKIAEEITEQKNITTNQSSSSSKETYNKTKTVERTSNVNWTLIWIVGIVLALVLIYILIRTYIPKFLKNIPNGK